MKKILALIVTGCLACGLMACGGTQETAATPAGTELESKAETAGTSEQSSGDKLLIGYSFPTTNNEFWGTNTLDCIKQTAEALGFDLMADDCNYDQAEQVADVESMISSGIDALVLAPQDASVCAGITATCKSAGIPVVIMDRWPGDDLVPGEDYVCFIGPDDVQAGYDIAMSLIDAGCKKLIGVGGVQGTSVGERRKEGLDKALAENPEVELLQFEYAGDNWDDGDKAFRSLNQAHSDIDGVWCFNDSLALASVNVLKEEGKLQDVKVGGMDLLSPAVESMQAEELWYSTGGHYMEAGFAAVIAYDVVNGVAYDGPSNTQLSLIGVDQTSVGSFVEQFIDADQVFDWASVSKVKNPESTYDFTIALN